MANCVINETFCCEQSTPSFYQWRDSFKVYGLKFAKDQDTTDFAETIQRVLEIYDPGYKVIHPINTMELLTHSYTNDRVLENVRTIQDNTTIIHNRNLFLYKIQPAQI